MNNISHYIVGSVIGLALLCSQNANAATEMGKVIVSSGNFFVIGPDKKQRQLTSGAMLNKGDTIVAPSGTQGQIRLKNGNLMSCYPNSSCHITEDNPSGQKQGSAFKLVKGGIQTLVAAVSNVNPSESKITSPVATIGVRGTFVTTALTDRGQEIAVWKGKAEVATKGGKIMLGPEAQYRFARVASPTSKPEGLTKTPVSLTAAIDPRATQLLSPEQPQAEVSAMMESSLPKELGEVEPPQGEHASLHQMVAKGDYRAAFEKARSMQIQHEGDPSFNFAYGRAALESNHPGDAVFAFERVLILEPKNYHAVFQSGRSYYELGDHNMARVKFQELLEMNPNSKVTAVARQYLAMLDKK